MWQAIIRCSLSISIDEAGVEPHKCMLKDEEQASDTERLSLLIDDALRPACITAVLSWPITCDYASLPEIRTLLIHQSRLRATG